MEIKNHLGFIGGKQLPYKATPNKSGTIKPEFIVLHDTASGLKPDGDISWLTDPKSKVSAHVVIARDGKITQLAPFNAKCWHAGQSKWEGRANCNDFTIGIEIDNPGRLNKVRDHIFSGVTTFDTNKDQSLHIGQATTAAHGSGYWMAYTDDQIESVIGLCRALVAKYPTIRGIITHWLISPGRKVDTNPLFPLEQVRDKVFGKKDAGEPDPNKLPQFIPDATVIPDSLNLRSMASMAGTVLRAMPRGERVDVMEVDQRTGWAQVRTTRQSGFAYATYLKLDI